MTTRNSESPSGLNIDQFNYVLDLIKKYITVDSSNRHLFPITAAEKYPIARAAASVRLNNWTVCAVLADVCSRTRLTRYRNRTLMMFYVMCVLSHFKSHTTYYYRNL